jgi:hypothetical protein
MLPSGFHQPPGAMTDPITHLLIRDCLMTEIFQRQIDSLRDFASGIEQRTV